MNDVTSNQSVVLTNDRGVEKMGKENSVVVGGWKENEEICLRCNANRTALREMLTGNKGNRVTAHTAIENCPACKRTFHKMLAVNLMRRK